MSGKAVGWRDDVLRGARTFAPVMATFACVAPIAHAARLGDGIVVLGVAVALLSARTAHPRGRIALLLTLAKLPVTVLTAAGAGLLLEHHRTTGDAVFVLVVAGATYAGRYGGAVAALARALAAPLLALFIAPVPLGDHPTRMVGWVLLVSAIAVGWALLTALAVPEPGGHPPNARAMPTSLAGRRALQHAAGLAASFALGQWLFPVHWTWVIITAYTVTAGTISRGEVALKAGERLLGALAGTALATAVANPLLAHRHLAVGVALGLVAAGLVLRQRSYAWWPVCVTSVLAILYGLLGQRATPSLLGERLLAIALGGALAVAAATLLRPVRTSALVHRRTGAALRALREAAESVASGAGGSDNPGPNGDRVAHARRELERLRASAAPLRLLPAGRRPVQSAWARELLATEPVLRRLATEPAGALEILHVHRSVGRAWRDTPAP